LPPVDAGEEAGVEIVGGHSRCGSRHGEEKREGARPDHASPISFRMSCVCSPKSGADFSLAAR